MKTRHGRRIPTEFRQATNYRMRMTMKKAMVERKNANLWELCEDTAKELDLSYPVVVWCWYEGKSLPTLYNLTLFAECFDVSIDYLLGRTAVRQLVKKGHLKVVSA